MYLISSGGKKALGLEHSGASLLAFQFPFVLLAIFFQGTFAGPQRKRREVKMLGTQLCPSLCDPMEGSPPVFSVHGILQARILEWITIP